MQVCFDSVAVSKRYKQIACNAKKTTVENSKYKEND